MPADDESEALDITLAPVDAPTPLVPGARLAITVPAAGRVGRVTAVAKDGSRVPCLVSRTEFGLRIDAADGH